MAPKGAVCSLWKLLVSRRSSFTLDYGRNNFPEVANIFARFTKTWPFIIVIWCAPQSNKTSRAMRNETVYIQVCKHWSNEQNRTPFTFSKSIFSFWSSPKMIEVGLKFRRNHHLRCKHQIVYIPWRKHLREHWLQWIVEKHMSICYVTCSTKLVFLCLR